MPTALQNPLVDALTRLPILDLAQREELPRLVDEISQPRELAKELIRRDWLTAYQANQIFLGHGDDLVLGHYVCLNKIGEGGMGHVFKARQRPLDRIVALKVLRRECVDNAKTVQRFHREMRAVGQLQHPHIVRAHDADLADGHYYIAMEYIEGIDLARMVKREGPIGVEPALDFIRQAALGLQHAHDAGLVHRDIKPANLLVAKETGSSRRSSIKSRWGVVKLLDLGLARLADSGEHSLTVHGTVMGTPDFIAPEQALNPHTCDNRADLYSLGCTLYYLIAGRIPFPRGSVTEKLLHHQMQDPEPIVEVRRARLMHESAKTGKRIEESFFQVPAEVDALVRKLMAKHPDDRFQSPAELAYVIEHLLARLTGDPMAITHVPSLTNPSLSLTPVPDPVVQTMPMPDYFKQRPLSWRSAVKECDSDDIVHVKTKPAPKRKSNTHWWIVGASVAALIAGTILIHGTRDVKAPSAEAVQKARK